MSQLGPATKPFEIMSIDTIGGFGGQRSTKRYLHLLVDHFTRYAFISTSKTQSATDFTKLVDKVLQTDKIGIILTDQYPGLNSRGFKEFLVENDVKLIFTAVNAPFSNGLNERLNQTLINKIRCKINEKGGKKAWTTIARECIDRYNKTEHTVTGFTPKYLLDGTDTSILPDEMKKRNNKENWIRDKEIALKRTKKSHEYNKRIFNRKRKNHRFNTGDLVYIENGNKLNRKKLDELRIGRFEIMEKISDSLYRIKTGKRKQEIELFHVTKLLPTSEDGDED
ncbi:RNA-directed DNA polymerase [Camponotus japonicus]